MNIQLLENIHRYLGESVESVKIRKFKSEDEVNDAIKIGQEVFKDQMSPKHYESYVLGVSDIEKSLVAIKDGIVIGSYFLGDSQVGDVINKKTEQLEDLSNYDKLVGVEGVAICIDPKFRGLGLFKKFIDESYKLKCDYIWGQAFESLNNVEQWKKLRRLVAINSEGGEKVFITLVDV